MDSTSYGGKKNITITNFTPVTSKDLLKGTFKELVKMHLWSQYTLSYTSVMYECNFDLK